MKNLYLVLCCALVLLVVGVLSLHVNYVQPKRDKSVGQTPDAPSADALAGIARPQKRAMEPLEKTWKNNLFNENRGKVTIKQTAAIPVNREPADLELVGIVLYGEAKSALIIDKNAGKKAPPVRKPGMKPELPKAVTAGAAPSMDSGEKAKPYVKTRRFFKENDPIGETGYVVVKIGDSAVTLRKDGEEMELKIKRDDTDSKSRMAQSPVAQAGPNIVLESNRQPPSAVPTAATNVVPTAGTPPATSGTPGGAAPGVMPPVATGPTAIRPGGLPTPRTAPQPGAPMGPGSPTRVPPQQ